MALPSASAEAQSEGAYTNDSYYLGYSGNLPHQEFGLAYGRIREQRWGIYIDVKVSIGVPGSASSDYYEDITVPIAEAWGHTQQAEKTGHFSLNIGTTRRLGSRLAVYGGIGLCSGQPYSERIGVLRALREEWEGKGEKGAVKGVRLVRFGRVGDWEGG